jgi:hypothetical protein
MRRISACERCLASKRRSTGATSAKSKSAEAKDRYRVLSWCSGIRAVYARFTLDQQLESFLRCHVHGFAAFGGVPREILYDNLKSVVLERRGEHILFQPQLLEMAGHYHFAPKPCAPYRGNEKGKVERTIQYLRHSFFAARRFTSIEDLNQQLQDWIKRVAHARRVPGSTETETVAEALLRERERLMPLPEHVFECDQVRAVCSGKQPYIRFDSNDYSIPHEWVRKPLTLSASETVVRLLDPCGSVIATHERCYDKGRAIENPEHIRKLVEQKGEVRSQRKGRDHFRSACTKADEFIEALCRRGMPMSSQTARLEKLLDRYGAVEMNLALNEALSRGAISADSVVHILEQRARARNEKPALKVTLPDDPRVRDLHVRSHDLKNYDELIENNVPKKETST